MPDDAANLLRQKGADPLGYKSHWITLPAGRMHYLDEGPPDAAQTLLFVHGNPTWCFHWRRLIELFRGEQRCVAMDHLGMGLSQTPVKRMHLADHIEQLTGLIDQLDLKNVTLVAQDWGGAIGLGALLDRADRFNRVVLFNTGAFPPPTIPRRIAACRLPVLGRLAVQGCNAFSQAALSMTLSRSGGLTRQVAAGYLAPYDRWSRRRGVYDFVADIPRTPRRPTWQLLAAIERRLPELASLPICLIWGMQDWCFTPQCLERFIAVWPHAKVTQLKDVGHWVLEDAPADAEAAVQQFLATSNPLTPAGAS